MMLCVYISELICSHKLLGRFVFTGLIKPTIQSSQVTDTSTTQNALTLSSVDPHTQISVCVSNRFTGRQHYVLHHLLHQAPSLNTHGPSEPTT